MKTLGVNLRLPCINLLYAHLGCPTMVRSDCGTENTEVASCHMTLRHGHSDVFAGCNSYRFGRSTTNTVSVCTVYYIFCKTSTHVEICVSRELKVGGLN